MWSVEGTRDEEEVDRRERKVTIGHEKFGDEVDVPVSPPAEVFWGAVTAPKELVQLKEKTE